MCEINQVNIKEPWLTLVDTNINESKVSKIIGAAGERSRQILNKRPSLPKETSHKTEDECDWFKACLVPVNKTPPPDTSE